MSLKLKFFASSLQIVLIIGRFLSTAFKYLTKHHLKQNYAQFLILAILFIKLFNSLSHGKYQLLSKREILEIKN